MFHPIIQHQMRRQAAEALRSDAPNVVACVLHWQTIEEPAGYDPQDQSTWPAEATPHTLPFRAFKHNIDHRMSGYQRFMELDTGSVILEYLADLSLDSKPEARIEIGGRFYVQKSVGKELLEMWVTENSAFGGLFRTVTLIPAS